ncbi:hypothetical protein KFK09_010428 [Dendrobium nobile]|uniref:Retrovirus-related Pol polyprotein from transposon TNT 1-94-like beta-barrel domain-containing protein n=1 Tax=Dendrobium nobile TaxID=94219 RepID=A0A8T3BCL0_DENNO|nr:hypothetical protein KFK09_010428 [Dendrobium nobile]
MAHSETSSLAGQNPATVLPDPVISSNLKFLVSNIKNVVSIQLSPDNFPLWKSQVLKIFKANGFQKFLDPHSPPPPELIPNPEGSSSPNPLFLQWSHTDQNLSASLCSTISTSVLPYVLALDSTAVIWTALETQFQSTNRSKVIQLKNELHNIALKNSTMTQYLTEIKTLVDKIAAAGSVVDTEDIILYILNGLPPSYQSFKTAIRTMLTPIHLDQLYPLLLSEEVNLANDAAKTTGNSDPNTALFVSRGRGRRSRGRSSTNTARESRNSTSATLTCQICLKRGHSAASCWHRANLQYTPPATQQSTALLATNTTPDSSWYLDSGASAHLTNSMDNLSLSRPYQGSDTITIGDGTSVGITNTGAGLLPNPSRKLHLSKILYSPAIRYNLISISQLTKDNDITITFNPSGFILKDMKTHKVLFQGPCNNGLYTLPAGSSTEANKALTADLTKAESWHRKLRHPNKHTFDLISKCNPNLNLGKSYFF